MNDEILIQDENDLRTKIHTIRGVQVMLDFDLAEIYGYDTRSFNKQVTNNIERFDEDFRFQLTKEEFDELILMCKNCTSSWGGTRKLPYAFTEQGIYMLMTVLKGDLAIEQSKTLIRLFKSMKDYLIENQPLLTQKDYYALVETVEGHSYEIKSVVEDIREIKSNLLNFFYCLNNFV